MRGVWFLCVLVGWAGAQTGLMQEEEGCACDFLQEGGVLSCSSPSTLPLPRRWCVEGRWGAGVAFEDVRRLRLLDSRLESNFSLDSLRMFGNLTALVFNRNQLSRKSLEFAHTPPAFARTLTELDLADNHLETLDRDLLRTFPALTTLNLNGNYLRALPYDLFGNNPRISRIHMKDNPWNCTELEWFLGWLEGSRNGVEVMERGLVNCSYWERGAPFGSTTLAHLLDECPSACHCRMSRSMVRVDCRGLGLTAFPPLLPLHTGILHMENNRIDSLHSLLNGTNYLNLRFLYLDNNSIASISVLEATDIFDGLFALHLSGNRLTEVPTHVIDRLFALYLDQVKFGNNPWNCECETVSPFYNLLIRFGNLARFKDVEDIRCSADDSYHPNQPIFQLRTSDFCVVGASNVNPLDILNVILVSLILLILAKLAYDCVRVQQTGRTPIGPFNFTLYKCYDRR